MKLGVCTTIENIRALEETGYNYIELNLSKVARLNSEEFDQVKRTITHSIIKAEAFNSFIPSDIKLVGEHVDYNTIKSYVVGAIDRAAQLGGEIIVFGSGGARNIPDGFSQQLAFEQLETFLNIAGEVASPYPITIVIEPLRTQECNIINKVSEGLELVKKVNLPNIRLLADYYHMSFEDESCNSIEVAGSENIRHIHFANPEGREYPKVSDTDDYKSLFNSLKKINYRGRVSIEGKTRNFNQDIKDSMAFWQRVIKNIANK